MCFVDNEDYIVFRDGKPVEELDAYRFVKHVDVGDNDHKGVMDHEFIDLIGADCLFFAGVGEFLCGG
jgi:hypothetical protein